MEGGGGGGGGGGAEGQRHTHESKPTNTTTSYLVIGTEGKDNLNRTEMPLVNNTIIININRNEKQQYIYIYIIHFFKNGPCTSTLLEYELVGGLQGSYVLLRQLLLD